MKQHLALYGNTKIVRGYCYKCSRYALVVDGYLQCCDRRVEPEPTKIKRMSNPEAVRKRPSSGERQKILENQDYRCLYCDVSLDGYVFYHGQIRKVRGKKITPAEAWGNKTQDFLFDTRAEAEQKMYELHQQGIIGWPHVIERVAKEQPR